jgi:Flp pilus assembly pilin Flp
MIRQIRGDERGQALVEFALIVPFLLLFLVGIIEFGRGWNLHQVVTDAAREAARTAVIHDIDIDQDSVIRVAKNALGRSGINPANATVTFSGPFHSTGQPISIAISVLRPRATPRRRGDSRWRRRDRSAAGPAWVSRATIRDAR